MDFTHSPRAEQLQEQLRAFMAEQVSPNDPVWWASAMEDRFPLELVENLKEKAKAAGLWNLFLPSLRDDEPGQRLSSVEYAPLAEMMGRIPWSSEVFNCSPPDSVNVEILHRFGSPEQRTRWLEPLLQGTIRSGVSMSEPDVASSDPANLNTTIERDGDELVVEGRKWFTNGAMHPHFAFTAVFGAMIGESNGEDTGNTYSFVIVPKDAPGFEIGRHTAIMGQPWPAGYCEVFFHRARVPTTNLIGDPDSGLEVASVLSPAVLHHCMRTLGQCELALELMSGRALSRRVSGRPLATFANLRDEIARSRIEIDQTRLLVLRAAWIADRDGDVASQLPISQAKVAAAGLQTRVVDRAVQVFGAEGLTADTRLAYLWAWGRALNVSFLVGDDDREDFENAAESAAAALSGRARLRLLGPSAAYDFVPDV